MWALPKIKILQTSVRVLSGGSPRTRDVDDPCEHGLMLMGIFLLASTMLQSMLVVVVVEVVVLIVVVVVVVILVVVVGSSSS